MVPRERGARVIPKRLVKIVVCAWALVGLGVFVTVLVITWRPHAYGNESVATSSLRTLNTALVTYASTYNRGFPETLSQLGAPSAGQQPDVNRSDFVDPVLSGAVGGTPTSFRKSGYTFAYTPGPSVAERITSYTISADPQARGSSGQRSFFTDQTGVIRANATAPATVNDLQI